MSAPLAEIVEEGRRLEAEFDTRPHVNADIRRGEFYRTHGPRLLAVAEAAVALFAALDYVTPSWRETTCIIDENSDEVNVAWCGLELALEHEPSTPEQIKAAFDAAVRGGRP